MGLSRLYSGCRKCPYRDTCENKKMEALAYMEPVAATMTAPLAEPALRKRDYRNIKIAENTTITIDLEEMKERLRRSHYPQMLREGM